VMERENPKSMKQTPCRPSFGIKIFSHRMSP
jgi:hypothetical protein